MVLVTSLFTACVVFIMASVGHAEWLENNIPDVSVLNDEEVQYFLTSSLLLLGFLSVLFCIFHWKKSIRPLYNQIDQSQEL